MNLIVKDLELFENIEPEAVASYLENQGWQRQRQIDDQGIIWERNGRKSKNVYLLLPLNREMSDFPLTMNLLVENLANIEGKTQLEIIQTLITNLPNVEIQGLIAGIESPLGDRLSGEIILMGVVINKLQKIEAELFDRDYVLAIKAYQERLPVSCWGDLVKQNSSFFLKNIRNFTLDAAWFS
ncbi:MAG: hypothetical protein GDA56_24905 [Hormoscilla sp. GM7CHS1pb]|nr:hypothetical protein [Hormoscilla sp. GM7CHS1pb]